MTAGRFREVLGVIAASAAGALLSAAVSEFVIGPALSAQGSKLEMGGIPLLLSAFVFAPLFAAMVAGLFPTGHPYASGFGAEIGMIAVAFAAQEYHGSVATTIISPAPLPLYAAIGLWGSLLVDAELKGRARRFQRLRDGSAIFAATIFFLALLGAAIHWVDPLIGLAAEIVAIALFFGWLSRRKRLAQRRVAAASASGPPSVP